jgi:hypothetical protein
MSKIEVHRFIGTQPVYLCSCDPDVAAVFCGRRSAPGCVLGSVCDERGLYVEVHALQSMKLEGPRTIIVHVSCPAGGKAMFVPLPIRIFVTAMCR